LKTVCKDDVMISVL